MRSGGSDQRERIIRLCKELGFALAGVSDVRPSERQEAFLEWLRRGMHGSMEWLGREPERRCDPTRVLGGARAAIMVADQYAKRGECDDASISGTGRIARYARGRDYHKVMKRRLHRLCDALREEHPDEQFRAFVDTAPVMERELAARAGLGWIGKHTLLIHPRVGSYVLLGGVLTTIDIADEQNATVPDHCGTCTRCIDACPTEAIAPYQVDASRCISYLTIESRHPIDPAFHEAIGDWLFGCDICQEVCPHNSARENDVGEVQPEYAPRRSRFDLLQVLDWREDDRRRAFAGTALTRAKLDMLKRNALIVASNDRESRESEALLGRVRIAGRDPGESDLVRLTARQVLDRLSDGSPPDPARQT